MTTEDKEIRLEALRQEYKTATPDRREEIKAQAEELKRTKQTIEGLRKKIEVMKKRQHLRETLGR